MGSAPAATRRHAPSVPRRREQYEIIVIIMVYKRRYAAAAADVLRKARAKCPGGGGRKTRATCSPRARSLTLHVVAAGRWLLLLLRLTETHRRRQRFALLRVSQPPLYYYYCTCSARVRFTVSLHDNLIVRTHTAVHILLHIITIIIIIIMICTLYTQHRHAYIIIYCVRVSSARRRVYRKNSIDRWKYEHVNNIIRHTEPRPACTALRPDAAVSYTLEHDDFANDFSPGVLRIFHALFLSAS